MLKELPDPVLAGIFIAAGSITITERNGKYTPLVYVTVHQKNKPCLAAFSTRFGGSVRDAPHGNTALAQWDLRGGKGIAYLCLVMDPFKPLLEERMRGELELLERLIKEDGRGRRGRDQYQVQANRKAIYLEMRQLQEGKVWDDVL
jgi:hypothetical protein